jgi:hypothetical protein
MARRKKPEDETPQEERERVLIEAVCNHAKRSEKTSWNRKMDNMVKLMAKLRPIEQKIQELQAAKVPVIDDITELRTTMIKECVHPYEYLVLTESGITCKFCEKKIGLPNVKKAKK